MDIRKNKVEGVANCLSRFEGGQVGSWQYEDKGWWKGRRTDVDIGLRDEWTLICVR